MATEGVTAGWQFLDDGDEMRIGPYRLIFQSHQGKVTGDQATAVPDRLSQEHGMALRLSFGLTEADRSVEDQDVPEQAATPGHDPDATPDPSRAESADPSLDASGWDPSAGSSVAAAGGSSDMPEKSSPSDDSEESKEQNWGWDSTTPVAPPMAAPRCSNRSLPTGWWSSRSRSTTVSARSFSLTPGAALSRLTMKPARRRSRTLCRTTPKRSPSSAPGEPRFSPDPSDT